MSHFDLHHGLLDDILTDFSRDVLEECLPCELERAIADENED